MKKLLQMKFMLLLCALIVGSGTMWAENKTINAGALNSGTLTDSPFTLTFAKNSGTTEPTYNSNGADIRLYAKGTVTVTIEEGKGNMTSIVFNLSAQGKKRLAPITATEGTIATQASGDETVTWTGSAKSVTFTVGDNANYGSDGSGKAGQLCFSSVDIEYTVGDQPTTFMVTYDANGATAGTVPVDDTEYDAQNNTVTVLGNTGNLAKTGCAFGGWNTQADGQGTNYAAGGTFNISANTTLYAKWTPYTITAQSNNESYGTVSLEGFVITGSPNSGYRYANPAYTVDPENSADVSQDGNEFTVTPTANTTITINFEAIPTHTATFSVNGTTTSQDFLEGAAITFPEDPTAIEGKSFVGWATTTIDGTTNTAPTLFTSATMGSSDVTYYAVFADIDGEPSWIETDLSEITTSDIFVFSNGNYAMSNNNGTSNPPAAVEITVSDSKIESVVDNLKWNVSGNATDGYTFYPNGTTETWLYCSTTASSGSNNNIRVGTGNRKLWEFDNDGYLVTKDNSTDRYLSIYNNSDFRGYINTDNAFKPKFYKYKAASYSGYATTVVAAAVAKPVITIAENPFLFSTTAEITCATSGATIKYSFDNENWNDYSEALTITETTTIYAKAVLDNDESAIASVEITKILAEPTVTIDASGITNTNVYTGTTAGNLAATVTYNETAIVGATVTWSGNNDEVATINEETGVVTLVADGSVTFTATYAGNSDYAEKTATYVMTVTNVDPNAPGSENNPYTVAEAIAATPTSGTTDNVYIKGIVSQFYNTSIVGDGNNYRYYISDDGNTTTQLLVYKGKGLNNTTFANADDLKIGDEVVILGKLTTFSNAPEVASGNYIVSLNRGPSITVADATINVDASSQGITRGITIENLTISDMSDFDIQYYDAVGEEVEKPSWIEEATVTVENSAYVLSCTVAANDVEARTAYLKVYAMNGDETIYSNLVTITQAQYVPDYATLPFEFDFGRADIEETNGLTQDGLGTDYNTSPKLKFDGTGDYVILKINEVPGTLTFDIKGNTFSDGTFKVQTSADGINYTDLQTYTELGSTQSEEFDIAANVRYIKWIYTKKVNGNVALGNISLGNTSMAVTIAAACTDGKGKYYGTFSSSSAFEVPENLTVSEIGIDDEGKMNVQNYESGAVVPANTGVMVSATTSGNFKLIKSSEAGTSILGEANALRPTGDDGITADEMRNKDSNSKFYRLTMHNGTTIGFWWGNDGGNSFDIAANKAYLAVSASVAGARNGFAFGDDATGISNVNVNLNDNDNCYDLQGRKVSTPGKGLYIVNGKKVVIK